MRSSRQTFHRWRNLTECHRVFPRGPVSPWHRPWRTPVSCTRERREHGPWCWSLNRTATVMAKSIITPRSTFTSKRCIVNCVPKAIQTRSERVLFPYTLRRRRKKLTSRQDDSTVQNDARLNDVRDLNSWTSSCSVRSFLNPDPIVLLQVTFSGDPSLHLFITEDFRPIRLFNCDVFSRTEWFQIFECDLLGWKARVIRGKESIYFEESVDVDATLGGIFDLFDHRYRIGSNENIFSIEN